MTHATLNVAFAVGVCLSLTATSPIRAGNITKIDVEDFQVEIAGDGWVPGEKVKLKFQNPDGSLGGDAGTVTADAKGNINSAFLQGKGQLIDSGDKVVAVGSLETSAAFVANNTHFDHPLLLPEINNYPLNVIIQPTDLPAAGFSGSISLIGTSNNATIVSQTTTYDAGSDTLTTKGIFDFTAFGPLSFTYDATGQFANAVDPATGDPLAGSQSVQASIIVGQVVAEPGTLALSGMGLLCLLGYALIRRNQMRAISLR